jgi:hypothetical protein
LVWFIYSKLYILNMFLLSKNVFFSRQFTPIPPPPVTPFSLNYLVIAGGGSGGSAKWATNFGSGGGGAGGYLSGSATLSNLLTFTVIVGAGGPTGSIYDQIGFNGSDSVFDSSFLSVVSTAGGGGGRNGGSGGGSLADLPYLPIGLGIPGQGFNGANGPSNGECGGGGGAGQAGATGATTAKGGDGLTWLDGVTRAGGGGGTRSLSSAGGALSGPGGAGGGGRGANTDVNPDVLATAGTVNTGSGGGVGWPSLGEYEIGGAGGSGIIKVRYAGTPRATGGTITQSGGFTYHEFTSSGTLTFTS